MDHFPITSTNNATASTHHQQLNLINLTTNNSNHDQVIDSFVLLGDYQLLDFYAVLCQLVAGLVVNSIVLISVLASLKQANHHAGANAHRSGLYSSVARRNQAPVVDLILAIICCIALLRLLSRSGLQIACFYGACFTFPSFCYLQGFFNTFLHCLHLWMMALFVQDRYIAHYHPSSYLSKCSHFVLYVTLVGVAFLTSMHFCAPIYGFSAYRFVKGELTCTIDWLSHFSCPYWIYTTLLVISPAFAPLLTWTLLLTYKPIAAMPFFAHKSTLSPTYATPRPPPTIAHQSNSNASTCSSIWNSKPAQVLLPCCTKADQFQNSATMAPNSFEMQPCISPTDPCRYQRPSSSSGSDRNVIINSSILGSGSFSRSISHLTKSHVLTLSTEMRTVTICAWITILSYTPKLLHNACKACLVQSTYPPITDEQPNPPPILVATPPNVFDLKFTFYVAYLEEAATCLLVPLILLLFNSKLRFSLILVIACLLDVARVTFRHFTFRGIITSRPSQRRDSKTRTSSRTSRHQTTIPRPFDRKSNKKSNCTSTRPNSLPSKNGQNSSHSLGSHNRSNSLRINYPSHSSAKASNHYQSENIIAVTII